MTTIGKILNTALSVTILLGVNEIACAEDAFPGVIHKALEESKQQEVKLKKTITEADAKTFLNAEDRAVFLFSRGLTVFPTNTTAAAVDFEAAKNLLPKNSPLATLAIIYHGRSTLNHENARLILSKLKLMTKGSNQASYWRPEQFALMIEIVMSLKQDALLAKTWSEMESRVRPAQRSDELAVKVAKYIEHHDPSKKKELIPIVESMAAAYPHSETARWAFQKLQQLACSKKIKYVYSLTLLSRLAGNTNLDEGLKYFLIELSKGPVRLISGQIKTFDENERIDYLLQIRFWNEAKRLVDEQLEALRGVESPAGKWRLARALNNLGQIQIKQGDYVGSAQTWSRYLALFGNQVDWRPATENLADSLVRLRSHGTAAKMYESLAQSPSSDPIIKWHHFWNVYLSGDYKTALSLLDRAGYVPQRDRGIEGGLDYWRAKILEKLGQSAEADVLYKKILDANGDNFYGILVVASKPKLLDQSKAAESAMKTVSFDAEADSNGFEPAEEIPTVEAVPATNNDSEIRAAMALKKWGQQQIARRVFRLIPTVHLRNGQGTWVESFRLALDLRDYGYGLKAPSMFDSPLRSSPTSAVHLEAHMTQYNADWKLLYPFAYRDIVESMSKAAGTDPFLILGVMRAESVYDADARSVVGARGLMQIMPFTAVRIARMMEDPLFDLSDLHRPEVNIGYASFYLRKLIDYYKGNPVLAVAAYNGGPVSVDRWVHHFGGLELDEFVETIPFRETRRYVKSVFKNFNQYKSVWQQSKALASMPKIPDEVAGGDIF